MLKIQTASSNDAAKWDDFVRDHELGTIYHTSAWREIIEKTYKHNAHYFYTEGQSGDITAAMPFFAIKTRLTGTRLVSLPAAQACNPLISDEAAFHTLLQHARAFIKTHSISTIELKTDAHFRFDIKQLGRGQNGYSIFVLDLDKDLTAVESALHKNSIRQNIKKAGKNDIRLVVGNAQQDVDVFYQLYLKMRKEYGLLPQPHKFFASMWQVLPPENIEILHAEYRGQIISSVLLLKYKNTVTYEYGASLSEMKNLGASPFLLWQAIERAHRDGYKRFDFGRVEDSNTGLVQFKKRWGAQREPLTYYHIPDLGNSTQLRQNGFSKRILSYSMQHLPEPVCQLAGSVLYRNFV